jgi:hypothetical protein
MMMRTRFAAGRIAVALLLVAACGTDPSSGEQAGGAVAEETAATTAPVEAPPHDDWGARFSPALFGPDSATIDNPWWPHTPGMQFTYEGQALDGGETIERRIVTTVTDLTKEIAGVRALVVWERDYDDDALIEAELSFRAQDEDGNIWHFGEYTEVFEDDELIGSRVWVPGDPEGAQAGIFMPADPKPGDPSFSQGFAPPPFNWDDRGRVREIADEVCVETDCFQDVVVIEEFEPSIPDALQLKSYARGVGHVRVGWDGANETEQEELELVERVELTDDQLAEARAETLAMENRANAYSRLGPTQPIDEVP